MRGIDISETSVSVQELQSGVCVCVCVCVCACVRAFVRVFVHVFVHVHVCLHFYVCVCIMVTLDAQGNCSIWSTFHFRICSGKPSHHIIPGISYLFTLTFGRVFPARVHGIICGILDEYFSL